MKAALKALGIGALWMHRPNPLLHGSTPDYCVRDGRGDEVWALIEQLETGAFV